MKTAARFAPLCLVCLLLILMFSESLPAESTPLDRAFGLMYNLDFAQAQKEITAYEKQNPTDPVGSIAEASGYLFSEFERLHILQSEFFSNDDRFAARSKLTADAKTKAQFDAALNRAEQQAMKLLAQNPNHKDALFSMALLNGLRADYTALIEKRDFAALAYTKKATEYADRLIAIAPDYYDAYLSTGLGKYIIGTKPAPMRWILRLGGYKGDREEGMRDLRITAQHGRYLAPFARLLLAVGDIRDHKKPQARQLLVGLRDEFPGNPLFAQEVEKIGD